MAVNPQIHTLRSAVQLRSLTAADLDVQVTMDVPVEEIEDEVEREESLLDDNDPRYLQVKLALTRYGGIIFSGPPGTSKTWYANQIARKLTDGDVTRITSVQFHPSYQYEDFMQGFVPREDGSGFTMRDKHFVDLCRRAAEPQNATKLFVLVIDELSRGDPGRVFGEALTYVERSKRGEKFQLASGTTLSVPPNLVVLATMNPMDRGVDEVDAAFERRFAKFAMEPSRELLASILEANGLEESLRRGVTHFFNVINGKTRDNPQAAVGHAYFQDARDAESLQAIWDYQLQFVVERAYRLDPDTRAELAGAWDRIFEGLDSSTETATEA